MSGWTALHAAAFRGHEAVVEMLVQNGADINAKEYRVRGPLSAAALKDPINAGLKFQECQQTTYLGPLCHESVPRGRNLCQRHSCKQEKSWP